MQWRNENLVHTRVPEAEHDRQHTDVSRAPAAYVHSHARGIGVREVSPTRNQSRRARVPVRGCCRPRTRSSPVSRRRNGRRRCSRSTMPNDSTGISCRAARRGLPFKEMSAQQRELARGFLQAGLSQRGYLTASTIIDLELVLREMGESPTFAIPSCTSSASSARRPHGAVGIQGGRTPSLAQLHARPRHAYRHRTGVLRREPRRGAGAARAAGFAHSRMRRTLVVNWSSRSTNASAPGL